MTEEARSNFVCAVRLGARVYQAESRLVVRKCYKAKHELPGSDVGRLIFRPPKLNALHAGSVGDLSVSLFPA